MSVYGGGGKCAHQHRRMEEREERRAKRRRSKGGEQSFERRGGGIGIGRRAGDHHQVKSSRNAPANNLKFKLRVGLQI